MIEFVKNSLENPLAFWGLLTLFLCVPAITMITYFSFQDKLEED